MARDLKGLSQSELASAAHVSAAAVSLYERGAATPTTKYLAAFADHLDVDVTFFYGTPSRPEVAAFFRSLRRVSARERRRARHRTEVVRELVDTLEADVRLPNLCLPVHPVEQEHEASKVEEAANKTRKEWTMRPGPIPNVVRTVERQGIVVARPQGGDTRIDAYSIRFPSSRPIIMMSPAKGKRDRSRFDVAHELGHLVIHDPAHASTGWVEKQAHRFAAAFLMPEEDIDRDLRRAKTLSDLLNLKPRWGVSLAALIRRQRDLEIIGPNTYTRRMKTLSARGWRRHEPRDLGRPEEPVLLKKAMEVAHLNEHDLASRTGFPIDLIHTVLDSDTRPLVEL